MRTLGLSLAGALMAALLGGAGGVVVAQAHADEEAPLGLAPVAGTLAYRWQRQAETASNDEDRWRYRGGLFGYTIEVDDSRLSGSLWATWSRDAFPDDSGRAYGNGGALRTGSVEIVNDEGSWRGTAHGYLDPTTVHWLIEFQLAGTGGYEGWSALLHARGPASPMDIDGFIFPGAWPEYPKPVVVPADQM